VYAPLLNRIDALPLNATYNFETAFGVLSFKQASKQMSFLQRWESEASLNHTSTAEYLSDENMFAGLAACFANVFQKITDI
jgi:hypothetical protein